MSDMLKKAFRYRWLVFAILALQYLFVYFHRVAPAVVAQDLISTFSISATSLGILASGYFYPYALMQIPVGLLSDSFGPRKTITCFAFLGAMGALAFGMAPTFGVAAISRIVVGLGLSGVFVPTMKTLAEWYRPREYAKISGALMAIGGIGWLSAATPLALVAKGFGWRTAFLGIGCITIILCVLTWLFVVDTPRKKGYEPIVERSAGLRASTGGIGLWAGIRTVVSSGSFWPVPLWLFCGGVILFGFCGLWAGPYLADIYGFSKPVVGNILSMVAVGIVVGGPLLGYLSDNVFRSRKKVLIGCSLVTTVEWAFFYLYFQDLPIVILYLFFFLMGVCATGASAAIAFTATKELFPVEIAGTSVSCANVFGFLAALISQPLMGHFLDLAGKVNGHYVPQGYRNTFLFIFAASIVFSMASMMMREEPGK
jgi:sugar phosphate permease